MMKESLVFTPPVFDFAPRERQIAAAIGFTEKVSALSEKVTQADFLVGVVKQLKDSNIASEQALKLAVCAFDYCLADEIRRRNGRLPSLTDDASIYYRFYTSRSWYSAEVIDRLSRHVAIPIQDLVIGTPNQIFHPSFPVGEKGMLTPELAFWINSREYSNDSQPVSNLPRQELFKSLMRCGVNPLAFVEVGEINKNNEPESVYRKMLRRKSIIYVNAGVDRAHDWETQTKSHWKKILDREQKDPGVHSEIFLFNCGFSANESVIYALSRLAHGNVFRHPFWYFENNQSISELFLGQMTSTISDAEAAFINLEPTNYSFLENQEVPTPPLDAIKTFIERAKQHSSKRFYLVIDATVDPAFSLEDLIDGSIPSNLAFIKTVSITKHQGGGRNYFYGAASVINGAEVSKEIEKYREELGGKLFEQQSVFFPRTSIEKIRSRKQRVSMLNKHIAHKNDNGETWQIIPYTFHSFLYPPRKFIDAVVKYCQELPYNERTTRMTVVNKRVADLLTEVVTNLNIPTIEHGDSFGLPETRIDRVGGEACIGGVRFWLKIPRICPGYEANTDELKLLAGELIAVFGNKEENLLEPLVA